LAGETPIRFFPYRISDGIAESDLEQHADLYSWRQFAVKAGAASFGGYWAFRPPQTVDSERFAAITASLAVSAVAAFPAEFARYGLADSVAAASKSVPAPKLGSSSIFHLEGKVAVGGNLFEAHVLAPFSYIKTLASLIGEPAAMEMSAADPLASFRLLNDLLPSRERTPFLDALATSYRSDPVPGARALDGLLFVPFFEFLGLLSEDEFPRVVQGFFFRHCQKSELVKLLFYRKTVTSADGAPKRVVIRPHGLDFPRLLAALPTSLAQRVSEQVKAGVSSPTTDDFLKRNEDAYTAALGEYRQGTLELGKPAAAALEYLFSRYVYSEKRKRLDAMIEKDFPMSALRAAPSFAARRAIDLSDFRVIAASLVGREQNATEIERWCSKRKMENVKEETRRLNALLDQSVADPDALCLLRSKLAKKAADAVKSQREERERELSRSRARELAEELIRDTAASVRSTRSRKKNGDEK